MRCNYLLVCACMICLASCQRNFYYQPASGQPDKAQVIFSHGVPSVRLNENGIDLAMDLTARGNHDMSIRLAIRNQSDSVFNFIPELVRVSGYDASGNKTPWQVFSAKQYIRRRNTRNAVIAGAAIVATVATVAAVTDNARHHNNNDNDWDDDNWFWAAAAIPNVVIMPGPSSSVFSPIDGLLRPHTLYSGEELRGIIKVQAHKTDKILVEIPIDGIYKQFVFDSRKKFN